MPIVEQISKDITQAMKAKEQAKLDALRMLKAALKNREIDAGHKLDDEEAIKVLNTILKQRREAAEQYTKGGRQELADKELAEAKIIETYLPAAASEEEIGKAVGEAITELNATNPKEMGVVMKAVMAKLAGKSVDGKVVSTMVKQKLGG
ncbi:MAG: GatB/YqeY domain-containing protein [Blastocatellia bacterium]|nr:GatB/YqeY domain-containing protein [Blastocatellia bacterium]